MKLIDIYNKVAKGQRVGEFKIKGMSYCIFSVDDEGYICQRIDTPEDKDIKRERVFIYREWLNKEVYFLDDKNYKEKDKESFFKTMEFMCEMISDILSGDDDEND